MPPEHAGANAACIEREIAWFREVLNERLRRHTEGGGPVEDLLPAHPAPALVPDPAPYADVVRQFGLGPAERLVLILSFLPHVRPDVLDPFLIQNEALQRRFTEFGGAVGVTHSGFLPTGQTALFLLAGDDVSARLQYAPLFREDHPLYRHGVLRLGRRHGDEPSLSAELSLSTEFLERVTTGRTSLPTFSTEFPAQLITTPYGWDQLVLDPPAIQEIDDIVAWATHQDTLMNRWELRHRLKPGFRSLFHGPPGTGKTLTASLLGQRIGVPVYRVDLSRVVSKYIGETEKNLAGLFDRAQNHDWILFFDEADALFGKRTESRSANDRHANQQVSYLLQRIEDYPGIVILATNARTFLDEAFTRRFQSVVHFRIPDADLRARLWADNFADKPYPLGPEVDLSRLAHDFELSGGSIINVLRFACLKAVVRDPQHIQQQDLFEGIQRELHKEGRIPR
jgi:hypothetical protein